MFTYKNQNQSFSANVGVITNVLNCPCIATGVLLVGDNTNKGGGPKFAESYS